MVRRFPNRKCDVRGFTILELQLAIMLTLFLVMAPTVFLQPTFAQLMLWNDSEQTRQNAVFGLESIRNDTMLNYNTVVDSTKCYQVCETDNSGNRTYYWINGDKLLRKREATTTAISCAGGTIVASSVNSGSTAFGTTYGVLTTKLAINGANASNNLTLYSRFIPTIKERDYALYEDFECNSTNQGWTVTNGASGATWTLLSPSVQGQGRYEMVMNKTANTNEIAYVEIPIDMSRYDAAALTFRYQSAGSFPGGNEQLVVDWYNGTSWINLWSSTAGVQIGTSTVYSPNNITTGLNSASRLRFAGRLTNQNAHWYLDNIAVYVP